MRLPRVALLSASTGVQAGGAEAYTLATARGLREAGVDVTVIHGRGSECPCHAIGAAHITGPILRRDGVLGKALRRLGIYRLTRTSPYDLEVASRGLLAGHRWSLLADFDIVEVQYATEALFLGFARPDALKVLHLHGPALPRWLPLLCRTAGSQPDVVVTCSEWSRRELIAAGIPWPVVVNYNGVDTELFRPPEARDRPPHRFRVAFVGRLSENKGLPAIARAAARLGPEFEFHIVGPAEGGIELPAGANLFYRGLMNSAQVADLLREMDCFYFPSVRESFGIAAVEAMATGLPVVANAVGGLPEVICDGVDGFLTPAGDLEAAVRRMIQLQQDPELRGAVGRAARATVLGRFTLSHTVRRLLDLHQQWSERHALAAPRLRAAEALP